MINPLSLSKEERRKALLLAAYFFLVIMAFWVQKPLRTSKFIHFIGAKNIPYAKLGTAFLVLPVMLLYSALARRVARERIAVGACAVFALCALAFWALFRGTAPDWAHYAFFFYVDIYITVMLAVFWSFANDITPPDQARRIYGVVGTGGIVGGAVGSAVTGWLVGKLGAPPLLMLCVGLMAAMAALAWTLGQDPAHPQAARQESTASFKEALQGAALTLGSGYLLCIAGMVTCYEITSNIVDYQFSAAAGAAFPAEGELGAFLGKLSTANISLSVAVQLLFTSWVLRRFGPRVGVLVLPALLLLGSAAYLAVPLFAVAAFMFSSDGVFNYSVNQSSKETLYTPTDEATKYQAKAFIDMFVFRGAKGVSALIILGFNAVLIPAGWPAERLSFFALGFIGAWLLMARAAGRRFDNLIQSAPCPASPASPTNASASA
ncbi:MAG: MFS transporter [Elusimicrobia bacterium]|nr:MFS transporter [Elusimicrobiota bacterium]